MQPQADPYIVPPCNSEITVLFRDEHLLLIDKPTRLLSLSGKHPLNKDSVHFRLVQNFPSATLVHRLDFGTSGVMIVALNKIANAFIGNQFQKGEVTKTYTAILYGHLHDDQGVINLPIAKDVENFPLQKICAHTGKQSLTQYQVITRLENPPRTRVLFTPLSGRTHQLRIHSREINHPILGCDLYATDEAFLMAQRLMLHATSIAFIHPADGKLVDVTCPCPF